MPALSTVDLTPAEAELIRDTVLRIHENCPGQTEFRYLSYIRGYTTTDLPGITEAYAATNDVPVLIRNLPRYDDIELTKIQVLLLGELVGNCIAYSDYNQSYISDIRPTTLSAEKSSGVDLLGMHNDMTWASDNCRPEVLALSPHRARGGRVPRTLLAPVSAILELLSAESAQVLRKEHFEARFGSALSWGYERVVRMSMLPEIAGRPAVRMNFGTFRPSAHLGDADRAAAENALQELGVVALKVGQEWGHAIAEGEALLIPNDYCLHGRDPIDVDKCERLLLRSYVANDHVIAHHNSSMVQLSS